MWFSRTPNISSPYPGRRVISKIANGLPSYLGMVWFQEVLFPQRDQGIEENSIEHVDSLE
jgi:hypothetical protein